MSILSRRSIKPVHVILILTIAVIAPISLLSFPADGVQDQHRCGRTKGVTVSGSETAITPANSGLISEKVNCIFIDSFNIKWFGTHLGISRFNGSDWDTITTDNYLLNNNVKQFAYERTQSGHEIWIATDGGLSVAGFDIDGVTSATTYTTGNSGLLNDTITAVGADFLHNRWIGTRQGLSVFSGSEWDSLKTFLTVDSWFDTNHFEYHQVIINGFASYKNDEQIYISTTNGGVLRNSYNSIDGFTGASTFGYKWSGLKTNNINSVTIYDTTQYYGTDDGFYIHNGNVCKRNWTHFTTGDGLLSNNVRTVEVDNNGVIWLGTDSGLSIKDGKKWFSYESEDGLINPVINDIKKDFEGNIWIATNGGIEYFSEIPGRQTGGFDPIQCMNVIAYDVTSVSSKINWIIGDVGNRIVFIKAGNEGLATPENNITYSADTVFGEGSEINGWYCIYNGTGNSVTASGLSPNKMYRVMACEYSGIPGEEVYVTFDAIGNPANFTTMKSDIKQNKLEEFTIFPNPFGSFIEIKNLINTDRYEMTVYRLDGKLIMKTSVSGNASKINTDELNPGAYIIQIKNAQNSNSFKVVKK